MHKFLLVAFTIFSCSMFCPAADPYGPIRAAQQQRVDAAQKAVKDAKALAGEAETRRRSLEKQVQQRVAKLGGESDPDLKAARAAFAQAEARSKVLASGLQKKPIKSVADLNGLAEYERLCGELSAAQAVQKRAQGQVNAALCKVASRAPDGRALADEWQQLDARLPGLWANAWALQARRDVVVRAAGGFLNGLKPVQDQGPGPQVAVHRIPPASPPDAAERVARFASRNTSAGLRALGERFIAQLDLATPGLETVRELAETQDYGAALDAYKTYFFAKLGKIAVPGAAGEEQDAEDAGDAEDEGGEQEEGMPSLEGMASFRPPTAGEIQRAFAGQIVETGSIVGKPYWVEATLGQPGAMNWVFLTPDQANDASGGPQLLAACRAQSQPGRPMSALLHGYALTGDRAQLRRWAEVSDDWCMNWQRDAEAFPITLRDHNILVVYNIPGFMGKLKTIQVMQPTFAEDLPASTLARLLMALNEECLAEEIRLGRSGLYNFRIMALMGMVPASIKLQEFRAHQWALREAWRQVDDNFIYKTRRDGANMEFANDGHENTDQALYSTFLQFKAWNAQPAWLEPYWADEFLENFLDNTRYRVHNLKQDGFAYRLSDRSQASRYTGAEPEFKVNLLNDEPEVRRRMWSVFRRGQPEDTPRVNSEGMAFQGYYYLREGWQQGDDFVYFQRIGQPVLSGREDDCGFSLYGHGQNLLMFPPLAVDGRVQNKHAGLVLFPGGKGNYATYGQPNKVQTGRFHSDDAFDLVEGSYEGVYQYHRPSKFYDVFGYYGYDSSGRRAAGQAKRNGVEFDDTPIRDVKQVRQLVSLRGRDLYIVTDRVSSGQRHEFKQNVTLPTLLRMDDLKHRIDLYQQGGGLVAADQRSQTLSTRNIGRPNVNLRCFSALPLAMSAQADERLEQVRAGTGKGKWTRALGNTDPQALWGAAQRGAVTWTGQGEQVVVTVVSHEEKSYGTAPYAGSLREVVALTNRPDMAGFTGRLEDGTRIVYIAAAKPAPMKIGTIEATASSFLLVGDRGTALDCTRLAMGDRVLTPPVPDFTFKLDKSGLSLGEAIYRPIQPVVIEPLANVFTEAMRVTLSCATPDVDLRYTLDGRRPTPASPLYNGPFEVKETCRLKVRAFRRGVKDDVWQQDGTHATVVYSAVLRKAALWPSVKTGATTPGLSFDYFEGPWTVIMVNSLTEPALARGHADGLFDRSLRKTSGAFGVRYTGYLTVPTDGVYTFHAPDEFIYPDIESGYDLRVFVDGREWYPANRWQGHGTWSVPLARGAHEFRVVYVDLRKKPHKIELQWGFPHPDFTWKGEVPVVQLSGLGLPLQPVPAALLSSGPAR